MTHMDNKQCLYLFILIKKTPLLHRNETTEMNSICIYSLNHDELLVSAFPRPVRVDQKLHYQKISGCSGQDVVTTETGSYKSLLRIQGLAARKKTWALNRKKENNLLPNVGKLYKHACEENHMTIAFLCVGLGCEASWNRLSNTVCSN